MNKVVFALKAFGINVSSKDAESIIELHALEQAVKPLEDEVLGFRTQLKDAEEQLAVLKAEIMQRKSSIARLKKGAASIGTPMPEADHRSKSKAALFFLRNRATVEPVHRGEISQYVYGDRSDSSLSRLALVLTTLKRKGLVRNGPRGYWFPL